MCTTNPYYIDVIISSIDFIVYLFTWNKACVLNTDISSQSTAVRRRTGRPYCTPAALGTPADPLLTSVTQINTINTTSYTCLHRLMIATE